MEIGVYRTAIKMRMIKYDPSTGRNRYWIYPADKPYDGYWGAFADNPTDTQTPDTTSSGITGKTVRNSDNKKKLSGTKYSDFFSNRGSYVTISAGGSNDVIYNAGNYVSINGGNNNDSISLSSDAYGVTIRGGSGNDTMSGSSYGDVFAFDNNHGTNIITNYSSNDTKK